MELKSVELQVAIPRSQDAGKMQDQLSRQGQQFQDTLAQQKLRKEIMQRQTVNKHEKIRKQEDKEREQNEQHEADEEEEQENIASKKLDEFVHPYLGKQVDFTR